jgi:hypothetical protein
MSSRLPEPLGVANAGAVFVSGAVNVALARAYHCDHHRRKRTGLRADDCRRQSCGMTQSTRDSFFSTHDNKEGNCHVDRTADVTQYPAKSSALGAGITGTARIYSPF